MEMNKDRQPGIITESIILLESNFIRYPVYSEEIEPKVSLSYTYQQAQDNKWNGILTAIVSALTIPDRKQIFEARIRYLGVFKADTENENLKIDNFIQYHAPAHIFPYLREFLTSLSTRSGLPQIILPPVNMAALQKLEMNGHIRDQKIEPKID
ncbi:MAG: preprotein translocase subunit SecB [Candidatus Cloacimonadota bacterium]|jgi:preprotein translocase subunit SecB|nr:preprotein translocase subunit SecB [Candidatus Cloacimonadota bacterium]